MSGGDATIYREIPRIDPVLLEELRDLTVADLHDVLPPAVRDAGLMDRSLFPITPGRRVHGQAVTAFCAMGDGLMSHCALYLARPGDVLVITSGGTATSALWGGSVALDAAAHGLSGVVIDGAVRDVNSIRALGHPTWAKTICVSRPDKKGQGGVNIPISCAGVVVNPGDIIVADDDGVLAFPPQYIAAATREVRRKLEGEADMRKRIDGGERVFEIAKFDDLLRSKGIAIQDGHWNAPKSGDGID